MIPNLQNMTKAELLKKISQLEMHIHSTQQNKSTIALDILLHELQESQQQLEATRDEYADLYDFAPINYITFDNAGLVSKINLTGAVMLCEVRANIVGHSFSKWLVKKDVDRFFEYLSDTLSSNTKNTAELTIKNKKNELIEVRIESIRTNTPPSNTPMCQSVLLDVTEYNRRTNKIILQSRQLQLITDTLPVLIAYIDINETHLFANKTYKDAFGYYFEDITGKYAADIWGENVYSKVKSHLRLAFAGKTVHFNIELPISDQGNKYYSTTLIPDYDSENHVYGIIIFIGDITDRLTIEAVDRKRLLDIAHFSRLSTMGEMASEIAHELNQPLAAISIYSDACSRLIMSDKSDKATIIQSLENISTQAERAGDFIRRIREFASKKEVQRIKININTLVEDAIQLLEVEIRSHNVNVEFNLQEDIPEIQVDKILIEQVIFNLARNALEAMDDINEENRFLIISTYSRNKNDIEVSIADTGPGISSENIKKIFESFYTTKNNGMGMGLAISHSIIEAHHGHIWATSNEHDGTTFTFTLPTDI